MSAPKRPGRALRRLAERATRKLVHDKQRLASLERGGAAEHPIEVASSAVIEVRAASLPCPLCEGELRVEEHRAQSATLRAIDVRCVRCGVPRTLYFRIAPTGPN